MSTLRTIGSYFGFLTSGSPVATTTTDSDGSLTTTMVAAPISYVSPDVIEEETFIATITVGSAAVPGGQAAALPANFSSFSMASMEFNPPLTNYTMSRITKVTIRYSVRPHDVDWYVGIWGDLPAANRNHTHIRRRAPNVFFSWKSNVTLTQQIEHDVPWPARRPISNSLHATIPGLFAPYLQVGMNNQPTGTASALPAGAYDFDVIVNAEVAGRGMLGTL